MKVTLMMVVSLDGRITKGDNPDVTVWTSKEDKEHFKSVKLENNLFVTGSKTYEETRKHTKPSSKILRVVLTRTPEKYKEDAVPGAVEFTSESPKEVVERLEDKGYKKMLLLGGSGVNGSFIKEGLVDEILLTLEPVILGEGLPLASGENIEATFSLESTKKLNDKGTLLLHYMKSGKERS